MANNENKRHYSIIVKPVGAACNMRCAYCYYLGKAHEGETPVMTDEVLHKYVSETIAIHGSEAEIEFAWHGGEPLMAGMAFYEKALALQREYGTGRRILNTLQTNGTLLNDEWCRFFRDNKFRIGISLDGPEHLHNAFRKDAQGNGTFHQVMRGVELLRRHEVEYNVLATVNSVNVHHPLEVYHFLRTVSDYIQFLPVVECSGDESQVAQPPGLYSASQSAVPHEAHFNVSAEGYGEFLCRIFDEWAQHDIGKKFVQIFEAAIGNIMRRPAGLCVHEGVCGHCAAIERGGNVYRCDRYVFPDYLMGNIMHDSLYEMMQGNRQFGEHKLESLSTECLHCDVVDLCFGGCPKDRFVPVQSLGQGKEYQNYLCPGYRKFFRYVRERVRGAER